MKYPQFKLYNTYRKEKEIFIPVKEGHVDIYSCGLTVYHDSHIGHAHMYSVVDFLVRYLRYIGYETTLVRNYTDVGHLVSDGDEGEDKMEKGARMQGIDVWKLAETNIAKAERFFDKLNIIKPDYMPRATQTIQEQIDLIQNLIDKGYAYVTKEAIYFDVRKFGKYEELTGQKLDEKIVGAREEVETGSEKKFYADFSLWFFTVGRFKNHIMRWDSPWGVGFPGWHIECSAMSRMYFDFPFDIHTGGEDHIRVHHANEIAQSECATGKKFANYWFHDYHLMVDGEKMSKSLGNFYTLEDVEKKGYDPMDFKLLVARNHYRQRTNFTWEAMESARNSRLKIIEKLKEWRGDKKGVINERYKKKLIEAISDDLNMPKGLAVFWEVVNDKNIRSEDKYATIVDFDRVFGLALEDSSQSNLSQKDREEIEELIMKRDKAKKEKDYATADRLREKILKDYNVVLEDTNEGTIYKEK